MQVCVIVCVSLCVCGCVCGCVCVTLQKTYGSSLLSDREYPSYSHLGVTPQPGEESEEDWAGSDEPSALEDAQEFVLSRTADCNTYSDPSSLGTEEEVSWQEDQGEEPSLLEESLWQGSRQGPVNYEGDDETSMVELSFRTQTGRPEGKRNHLQKVHLHLPSSVLHTHAPVIVF